MADDLQVKFGASITGLLAGVDQAKAAIESVGGGVDRVADSAKRLLEAFGIAFSIEKIGEFIERMGELGLQTERTMAMLGLSAQETVELGGMAKLTGTSLEGMTLSLERMALNIQRSQRDAFDPASQGLSVLGLRAKELIGIPTLEYVDKLHDAVSRFNPSLNLTTAVMAVGGRGIAQLIPLLQLSGQKWEEMRERIRGAQDGLAAAIPGMSETHQNLSILSMSLTSLGARIFTALKPAIDWAVTGITNFVQRLDTKTIRDFATSLTETLTNAVITLITWFYALGGSIDEVLGKLKRMLIGAAIGGTLGLLGGGAGAAFGAMVGGSVGLMWDEFKSSFDKGEKDAEKDVEDAQQRLVARVKAMGDALKLALANGGGPGEGGTSKANAGAMNITGKDALTAAMASVDAQVKVLQQGLERAKLLYEGDAQNFNITQSQKFALIAQEVRQTEAAEIAKYQAVLTWGGLTQKQRQDYENKIVELRERTATELTKIDQQQFAAERAQIGGYVGSIESSWNSSLRGMLAGTTTLGQAMKKVFADFVIYGIEQLEKMLVFEKIKTALTTAFHTEGEAAKTAATAAGVSERQGIEDAGFLASAGKYIADAMTFIGAQVAKAFAAMVAFLTPVFGPAAPAAAVGIIGGVSALAIGMIRKFDVGTDMVTKSGLAYIHKGEKITPAESNGPYTGGGEGASGGDVHLHIYANDANSFVNQLKNTRSELAQIVQQLVTDRKIKMARA